MKVPVPAVLALLAAATLPLNARATQADSVAQLRRAARDAEFRYEGLVRRLAPVRYGGFGSPCDEIVGRYCLRYDSPDDSVPPAAPEPARVTDARRAAIEALRRVFSVLPGEFEIAGPLVRYLVEDGRQAEALPGARLFRAVSGDSVWGALLEGFALHAAGRISEAEDAFGTALGRMAAADRERIERLDWILDREDRGAYRALPPEDRRRFEIRFWRLSDPLFAVPGNEARAEHIARHVWSRILARAPVALGAQAWGSDLEQLTIRFGTPAWRTRIPGRLAMDESIVEHFDPRQLAYTPEALLVDGMPPTPLPGQPWELHRKRTRAGYSARGVNAVRFLPHQVSRLPAPGGWTVRFDGEFPDSLPASRDTLRTGLWLLDEQAGIAVEMIELVVQKEDTTHFDFETPIPAGGWIYSFEALDPTDSAAARARYSLTIDPAAAGLRLSDPVIIPPFRGNPPPAGREDPAFQPRASLVFTTADTIGVYIECDGLRPGTPARLRLSLQPASRANLPARILGWIGRTIGLASGPDPVFVEWTDRADADGRLVLAFELPPQDIDDGNHVLEARLTDLSNGAAAGSSRIIRFVPPAS